MAFISVFLQLMKNILPTVNPPAGHGSGVLLLLILIKLI
jgi:hypothetical protein